MSPGEATEGVIFDVDTFAVHDGPGIRLGVYLKGCPLACAWCHSPESQAPQPEVIFLGDRCVLCGACGAVCQRGVHRVGEGTHAMARDQCAVCGRCVDQCPTGALAVKGCTVSAGAIVARAVRMRPFFETSGGGVTLTGGEATGQVEFAAAVLDGCRDAGIHTAVETCGACAWDRLAALTDRADLVLYDLKLIDDAEHRRWTGASNAQALTNARRLAGRAADVDVRVALIPGITDTPENLSALLGFVRNAGLRRVTFLPYNPSAAAKYEWFQRPYTVHGETQSPQQLRDVVARARSAGLEARVE